MPGYFRETGQAHQATATPYRSEARQHLAQVRAGIEMGSRAHRPGDRIVGGLAFNRDQRQSGIARKSLWMRSPDGLAQTLDFRQQTRRIEREGQLDKRNLQFHRHIIASSSIAFPAPNAAPDLSVRCT